MRRDLYYGYRYYNPSAGRWGGPDPVGELGGVDLASFCATDPVNRIDVLGLTGLAAAPPTTAWQGPYLNSPGSFRSPSFSAGLGAAAGIGIALINFQHGWLMEGIYIAIFDNNGLPRPTDNPYGENAVNGWAQGQYSGKETTMPPREEIGENARMMEELFLLSKVIPESGMGKTVTNSQTCCKFVWSRFQLGGWPEHDIYAAHVFGNRMELVAIAPDGETARYDGGFTYPKPITVAGEVKTGR